MVSHYFPNKRGRRHHRKSMIMEWSSASNEPISVLVLQHPWRRRESDEIFSNHLSYQQAARALLPLAQILLRRRVSISRSLLCLMSRNSRGSDNGSNAPSSGDNHHARRAPSRKDLQKQQRLIKRVSDLEDKLQAAHRQLEEAMNEPVLSQPYPRVGRSRFVPGALSTLPLSDSLVVMLTRRLG